MDNFQFLSFTYFGYLLISAAIVLILFFAFRKTSRRVKLAVLYILALFNVAQHLFKSIIWPHLAGTGFSHINTFYNVCAAMILLTPFFLYKKRGAWREAVALVGCSGGLLATCIPYWFIGKSILQWEFLRFWTCHEVLFLTSVLPILWKMVHFKFSNFWKIGLCFFTFLSGIFLNDVLCVCSGLAGSGTENLYASLYNLNPLYIMHPPEEGFEWVVAIIKVLTPKLFLGGDGSGYTPVLWYFIPFYMLITLVAIPVELLLSHTTRPRDEEDRD